MFYERILEGNIKIYKRDSWNIYFSITLRIRLEEDELINLVMNNEWYKNLSTKRMYSFLFDKQQKILRINGQLAKPTCKKVTNNYIKKNIYKGYWGSILHNIYKNIEYEYRVEYDLQKFSRVIRNVALPQYTLGGDLYEYIDNLK